MPASIEAELCQSPVSVSTSVSCMFSANVSLVSWLASSIMPARGKAAWMILQGMMGKVIALAARDGKSEGKICRSKPAIVPK